MSVFEFRKFNLEDFKLQPDCFKEGRDYNAKCVLVDFYGMLFEEGSKKPKYFVRHSNPTGCRFGSVFEPGDGYLSLQKNIHETDMAQKGAETEPWRDMGEYYQINTIAPFSEEKVYIDHATIKEGNFLELRADFFPFAIFEHSTAAIKMCQIMQPCIFTGTLDGKKVIGMGNHDKVYYPQIVQKDSVDGEKMAYFWNYGIGIREDDKKEAYFCYVNENNEAVGFYWLEGQEPVITETPTMKAEWARQPYVTDGTCVYESADYDIAGVDVHFRGEWGSKGITAYPRLGKHGQSQVWGDWYAGNTPYKHKLFMNFNENMEAYDYKLEKLGYKVK